MQFDFCIVGAGPAGLTLAYELLRGGRSVLMVERQERIGGLAKSYNYQGHIFDTGPKRFHTDDPVVLDFIHHILEEDVATIGRSTKVHFSGKYFSWPLGPKDLFKLPPSLAVRSVIDLMKRNPIDDPSSFHQVIRAKYGEALYRTFFAPYTQKFLRWDPDDVHADWAVTGINRTVIDKKVAANSLFDVLKSLTLPQKIDTKFLYPKQGGFGGFYDKLFALCEGYENFEVILGDTIEQLLDNGAEFSATTNRQKQQVSFDQLVWSGNLNDLCNVLAIDCPRLSYLNTIFYNIICRDSGIGGERAQWIYVSKGDSLISRITCMREFVPETCPDGYYNVICELTDSQTEPVYFKDPRRYRDAIIRELKFMSFMRSSQHVEDIHVNPVRDTYPIYHSRYRQDFADVVRSVKKSSRRIHLLGRTGAFWYNNSDHSIRMAIDMGKFLAGKSSGQLDFRKYFGGAPTS